VRVSQRRRLSRRPSPPNHSGWGPPSPRCGRGVDLFEAPGPDAEPPLPRGPNIAPGAPICCVRAQPAGVTAGLKAAGSHHPGGLLRFAILDHRRHRQLGRRGSTSRLDFLMAVLVLLPSSSCDARLAFFSQGSGRRRRLLAMPRGRQKVVLGRRAGVCHYRLSMKAASSAAARRGLLSRLRPSAMALTDWIARPGGKPEARDSSEMTSRKVKEGDHRRTLVARPGPPSIAREAGALARPAASSAARCGKALAMPGRGGRHMAGEGAASAAICGQREAVPPKRRRGRRREVEDGEAERAQLTGLLCDRTDDGAADGSIPRICSSFIAAVHSCAEEVVACLTAPSHISGTGDGISDIRSPLRSEPSSRCGRRSHHAAVAACRTVPEGGSAGPAAASHGLVVDRRTDGDGDARRARWSAEATPAAHCRRSPSPDSRVGERPRPARMITRWSTASTSG